MAALNARIKRREVVRPLAPMATMEAAQKYFSLDAGACADNFNAYNYMVLCADAREIAREEIPAVVHHDGTSRIQIVRKDTAPLVHGYLKALGNRTGIEVSVNTSLNIGSPIVQTIEQAVRTVLLRAKGLTAILAISRSGEAYFIWNERTCHKLPNANFPSLLQKWNSSSSSRPV